MIDPELTRKNNRLGLLLLALVLVLFVGSLVVAIVYRSLI